MSIVWRVELPGLKIRGRSQLFFESLFCHSGISKALDSIDSVDNTDPPPAISEESGFSDEDMHEDEYKLENEALSEDDTFKIDIKFIQRMDNYNPACI